MDFFVVDTEGNIVRTGSCDEAEFDLQAGPGQVVHQGAANGLTQFYDNGALRDYTQAQVDDRLRGVRQGYRWSRGQWYDERSLTKAKEDRWLQIKRDRAAAEFGTFTAGGFVFDADRDSQARILAAMQAAIDARSVGEQFTVDWTLADGTEVALTRAQVIGLGRALQAHTNAMHTTAKARKAAIQAATTVAEVDAIHW